MAVQTLDQFDEWLLYLHQPGLNVSEIDFIVAAYPLTYVSQCDCFAAFNSFLATRLAQSDGTVQVPDSLATLRDELGCSGSIKTHEDEDFFVGVGCTGG